MSKKTITLYIFAAIFIFCGFVISRTPANIVLAQLAKSTKLITPYKVSGTIWNGSAADITVHYSGSAIPLGATEWKISFLPLLLGKLDIHLQAIKSEQKIIGQFKLGSGPYLQATDAEIIFDVAMIKQFYPVPGQVQGSVELTVAELVYDVNKVEKLAATAILRDFVYTLSAPVKLGTYAAKLTEKDNKVIANLSDVDASVIVSGEASVSVETKKYNIDVNLKPKPDANVMIQQTLEAITRKKPDGSFQFIL